MENVILVDENDRQIGLMEKMEAHLHPTLHRAFSIFIFNSKHEFLLQQRALTKYHSPGLWTNTCCSHPRDGESLKEAASRRLMEEMGMQCQLQEIFSFIYKADVGQGLTEHEFDHVFLGITDDVPIINRKEVEAWKYISVDDLKIDMAKHPESYTAWFKIALNSLESKIESL